MLAGHSVHAAVMWLLAWLAAFPAVASLRQANFELYTFPPPAARATLGRSAVTTVAALGSVGAGVYAGSLAYKRLGGRYVFGHSMAGKFQNVTTVVDNLVMEQLQLEEKLLKVSEDGMKRTNELLADINTDNTLVKERIAATAKRMRRAERFLTDESNDLRESIKYASETISKHLRDDIADEVANFDKVIKGLRSEVSALIEEQHEYYIDKLKNYTETIQRTVKNALRDVDELDVDDSALDESEQGAEGGDNESYGEEVAEEGENEDE
jgi:hypothetical protein